MKSLFKKLSGFFVLLYIVGTAFTAYQLIELPQRLAQTKVVNMMEVKQLAPVLEESSLYVGVFALIGFLTILFLIMGRTNTATEEVRIAQLETEKQQEGQANEQKEEHTDGHELKAQVRQILEDTEQDEAVKALNRTLATVCNHLSASQGAVYLARYQEDKRVIELKASYAYAIPDSQQVSFEFGEGLAGQVAKEGRAVNLNTVPEGYIKVLSGLGSTTPSHLVILPVYVEEQLTGVVEIASFEAFTKSQEALIADVFAQFASRFSEHSLFEQKQLTSD